MLDCTYRVQISHRTGQLARVMGAIAEGQGLIGDVVTISVGREASEREITVEVRDIEQAERIEGLVDGLDGARVLWYQDRALIRHEGGKLHIDAVRRVATVQEMRDVYTPGVARVCSAIAEQPELAGRYTMISRSVAICTNGTRVLGLGNIGPMASMPVMEGKAVFYRQFAGISAMPVLIDTQEVDEFVETVGRIVRGATVVDPALVQELLAARRVDDPLTDLTQREREVLSLMAQGRSNSGIARRLWVTEGTVEKHVHNILGKLRLPDTDDDHRRVLAVVAFLGSR